MNYPLSELSRIRTRVERDMVRWAKSEVINKGLMIRKLNIHLSEIDSAIAILSEHQSPRVESLAKELDDNYFG